MTSIKNRYKDEKVKVEEEKYNDDVGDDEGNSERPRCMINIGESVKKSYKVEVQSNIDGYSQSDIWENEIDKKNDKNFRIFNKLKKNANDEYRKVLEIIL